MSAMMSTGDVRIERQRDARWRKNTVERLTKHLDPTNTAKLAGIIAMLIDVAETNELQRIADVLDGNGGVA